MTRDIGYARETIESAASGCALADQEAQTFLCGFFFIPLFFPRGLCDFCLLKPVQNVQTVQPLRSVQDVFRLTPVPSVSKVPVVPIVRFSPSIKKQERSRISGATCCARDLNPTRTTSTTCRGNVNLSG